MTNDTMDKSCRIALAAFLHDLGKFAERARIPQARDKDADGNTRQAINEGLYCPEFNGRRTHIHAAYTAIGMDLLEDHLPDIVGYDMSPFGPWGDKQADDSIINAAAAHHRPDTFLQWIIATADRLASGFERETFDVYNASPDDESPKLNHYTTRQETLVERISLTNRQANQNRDWRYPLRPLCPESLFPMIARNCETGNRGAAQAQYLELWEAFRNGLGLIPVSHRANLSLWLDHFESLWLSFTYAIPSATAGIGGKIRPDVSLYDHSKTTAALAVALWRYHADNEHAPAVVREHLRAQWDSKRSTTEDAKRSWEENKFLLIQGDFTGIQNFIFSEGGQTQKNAAKLLRGRSFYVSLLSELAALKVLHALGLPSTSQVVNAAGKFMIVAPNTEATISQLQRVQAELDAWFLEHTWGQSGVGLAWLPAAARDFRQGKEEETPFRELIKRLFDQLEAVKLRRFDLCGQKPAAPLFSGFLNRFERERGECRIDGRSPATELVDDIEVSALAADQIFTGKWLATSKRLLVTRENLEHNTLRIPIFGYYVSFTQDEDDTGKFGPAARSGSLLRAWDFALPESSSDVLWNGYARRHLNAFVPRFTETDLSQSTLGKCGKYEGLGAEDREMERMHAPKTLNHLARDARQLDASDNWVGAEALMTLKGDVDNLGQIFQKGLETPTFSKMAALSRQINAFFAVYLPWLCKSEFPDTYTVFAGGDDFFLIGPWYRTMQLAKRMRADFSRYVAENPDIHFSAGLSMTKPGLPIRQLGGLAEVALDDAKMHAAIDGVPAPKNAVTCFGQSVHWDRFEELLERAEALRRVAIDYSLSTGYLYALLRYTDMAADMAADRPRPRSALWHSQFAYRTRRLAETKIRNLGDRKETEDKRRRLQSELGTEIAGLGIEKHGANYKIALFTYLYQQRD